MSEEGYYIGTDLKFQIEIVAAGFNQKNDKYTIDFYCNDKKVKTFTQDDVKVNGDKFYLPVPTSDMIPGLLRIVTTAFVPDDDFPSGYRKEIAIKTLKYLKTI